MHWLVGGGLVVSGLGGAAVLAGGGVGWILLAVLLIALWPWRNRRFGPASWLVLLLWLGGTAYAARFSHQATRAAWRSTTLNSNR